MTPTHHLLLLLLLLLLVFLSPADGALRGLSSEEKEAFSSLRELQLTRPMDSGMESTVGGTLWDGGQFEGVNEGIQDDAGEYSRSESLGQFTMAPSVAPVTCPSSISHLFIGDNFVNCADNSDCHGLDEEMCCIHPMCICGYPSSNDVCVTDEAATLSNLTDTQVVVNLTAAPVATVPNGTAAPVAPP